MVSPFEVFAGLAAKMLNHLRDFGLAWRLLTIIPLPFVSEDLGRPAGRAVAYFPLVGTLLGLILAGTGQLCYWLLPEGIAAGLLLAVWAGLTGLLHLDGFMDSCDGLLPPREPARRLEIMKDSRVGAFGVVGVILLLLLKFNGLGALLDGQTAEVSKTSAVLIIIPTLARWAMVWQMARYPLARPEGLAVFFKIGLDRPQIIGASVTAIIVTVTLGWVGLILLGVSWLTTMLLARFAVARLGGLTGDVYGATGEIVEVILLVVISLG